MKRTIDRIRQRLAAAIEPLVPIALMLSAAGVPVACESGSRREPPPAAGRPAAPSDPAVATEGSRTVLWSDLRDSVAEAAGGIALEEHLLDRAVAAAAARRGVSADAAAIESERQLLLESLAEDPDRAEELLQRIRARQGLGPRRFESLLRRNALLRAMVAGEVEIDAAAIARVHDVRHGPRRRCRLIASPSLAESSQLAARVAAGEAFAAVAFERSIDPSRDAGGLLPPVARLDPAWPPAFREALFSTSPGSVSTPVFSDGNWLLLEVLEETSGDGTSLEAEEATLRRLARIGQERVLMDRLARELAASLSPRIIDPSIRSSWEMLRSASRR